MDTTWTEDHLIDKLTVTNYGWFCVCTILTYTLQICCKVSITVYIYCKNLNWLGLLLWHINHCWLSNAKSCSYINIKCIWFGLVGFYRISTIVGYLMLNPVFTSILDIYDLVGFYGISTIVGYLMQNPVFTSILNIYDLVGFYGISTIVGYLIPNPVHTSTLNIYNLVWLGFMAYQPLLVI